MTEQEIKNALSVIWNALHAEPDDEQWSEEQWDQICDAMAYITEEIGLNSSEAAQ